MIRNAYTLLEDKVEDFIKGKKLTKDLALQPDNVKALKKILKKNEKFTRGRIEKYFSKHSEVGSARDSQPDASSVKVSDKVKAAVDGLDGEKKQAFNGILTVLGNAASTWARNKTGKLLDELFMGNFKDAVADILARKIETDDDAQKMFDSLQKNDEYVKAKNAANSRKADAGPIGEVTDPVFNVMWYGGNDSVGA